MRLFDQGGGSPQGWGFLKRHLQDLRGDRRRVLISGSADTGLMAIILSTFVDPASLRIVLADRCETTLQQNLLFARHLGHEVEVHPGDIRSLTCESVDAIVGHSFLNYFDDVQRPELMASWMRALRPGGVLLLSNRLSRSAAHAPPDPTDAATTQDASEAQSRRLAALRSSAASHGWSEHDCDRLVDAALAFWAIPSRKPVLEEAVRLALTRAGFDQIRIDFPPADGACPGPRPLGRSRGPRAEILARRPAP